MGVVYSMYDALVSINIPDEKAKAVIDALEREMMDKLATKADIAHFTEALSKDIRALEAATKADFAHFTGALSSDIRALEATTKAEFVHAREIVSKEIEATSVAIAHAREILASKAELAALGKELTTKLYATMGTGVVLTISVLGMLIKLT
jgi:hypothetical protein